MGTLQKTVDLSVATIDDILEHAGEKLDEKEIHIIGMLLDNIKDCYEIRNEKHAYEEALLHKKVDL